MEKKLLKGTPSNIRELNNKCKDFIIDSINNKNVKTVLDIATGRGMLLTELVKSVRKDVHIICTDLSFTVLNHDRVRMKNINSGVKVTYIACDATKLPFKDASIDMAVSFSGIINMMDKIQAGIKEANRVLDKEGHLLNSSTLIEKGTNSYKESEEFLREQQVNMDLEVFTREGLKSMHQKCFKEVEVITIGESIGEKCDFDLIPFEGEWFAEVVAKCTK